MALEPTNASVEQMARRVSDRIAELRSRKEQLQRELTDVSGRLEELERVSKPRARRRSSRSSAIALTRRRETIANVLQEHGPMAPGDLFNVVKQALADHEKFSRSRLYDTLRKHPDVFEQIARGRWGLTHKENGRPETSTEERAAS